jgi:hypothetical protein
MKRLGADIGIVLARTAAGVSASLIMGNVRLDGYCFIPLGLIVGGPFSPFRRVTSACNAAFFSLNAAFFSLNAAFFSLNADIASVNAEIFASASSRRRFSSSRPTLSRSGGDPVMSPQNRVLLVLGIDLDQGESICRTLRDPTEGCPPFSPYSGKIF